MVPTRRRAAIAWRREHELAAGAATPFEWSAVMDGETVTVGIAPHDFRRTAATMLRDAGFTKEQAATRLGHADDGQLLDRVYDRGDRVQRGRRALDEFEGVREALAPAGARRRRRAREHAGPTPRPRRSRHLRAVG